MFSNLKLAFNGLIIKSNKNLMCLRDVLLLLSVSLVKTDKAIKCDTVQRGLSAHASILLISKKKLKFN